MNTNNELAVISSEYESYFPECELVLLSNDDSHIQIITQEGILLKVSVNVSGWYQRGHPTHYETFELLMNTVSPAFRDSFANDLMSKLGALQQL